MYTANGMKKQRQKVEMSLAKEKQTLNENVRECASPKIDALATLWHQMLGPHVRASRESYVVLVFGGSDAHDAAA